MFPFGSTRLQSVFCSKEADEASYDYWMNMFAAFPIDAAGFEAEARINKHTIVSRNERLLNKITQRFLTRAMCALTISAGRL
jgi:hypothetical protein